MSGYNPRAPSELEGRNRVLWSEDVELSGPHSCDVSERWWELREDLKYDVDGSPLLYVLSYVLSEGVDDELREMDQDELEDLHRQVHEEVSN